MSIEDIIIITLVGSTVFYALFSLIEYLVQVSEATDLPYYCANMYKTVQHML